MLTISTISSPGPSAAVAGRGRRRPPAPPPESRPAADGRAGPETQTPAHARARQRPTAPEPDCDRHGATSEGATEDERVWRVPLSHRVHAGSVDRSGPNAATAACSSETPPRPWVAAAEVAATNHDDRGASAPCRPWFGRGPIGGARGPGLAPSDEHAAVAASGYGVRTRAGVHAA